MDNAKEIIVISNNERHRQIIEGFIKQYAESEIRPKKEFLGISVKGMKPERLAVENLNDPLLVISQMKGISLLMDKLKVKNIPVILIAEEYNADMVNEVMDHRYFFINSIFRARSFEDPEECGHLAAKIKQEVRRSLRRRGEKLPCKSLGWKIQTKDSDYRERPFVSLFLDSKMIDFLHHLLYTIDRVRNYRMQANDKPFTDAQDVLDIFRRIGEALSEQTGKSKKLKEIKTDLKNYIKPESVVRPPAILLEGETGTGKTLIARWLNQRLSDAGKGHLTQIPMVNVSEELLETELFGSVHGAFTGSVSRPGRLLLSWGQTVFLDEIGDAPPALQAKLLVYLDRFAFQPLGWPYLEPIYSPTYIIAATNKDLQKEIKAGNFRDDLYHRFRYKLKVPPMHQRKSDLRVLIDYVLQDPKLNKSKGNNGKEICGITIEALEKIETHIFRGNFRELEDLASRAVYNAVMNGRDVIEAQDIELYR